MSLTCKDCAVNVDCGRYQLGNRDPCNSIKPHEFSRSVEDSNGGCPGVIRFVHNGDSIKYSVQYPLKSGGFKETEPITFKKLNSEVIDSMTSLFCSHCDVKSRAYVANDIEAILKELQDKPWYPKKFKTESKKPSPITEEEPIREEVPEHIKIRAREIAEQGNPLDFILRTHQTLHVGDIGYATTLLLSCTNQSSLNSEGLQPKGSGASGKGKSHCTKAMAHLIPKEWILTASLSNKAIYYMKDRLKPGMILFCDDVKLSEEMEGIIKRATTFYQTGDTYITIDTNRKDIILRIPARLVWWMTSVDDDQSIQLLNRTFGAEVDESEEQDEAVAHNELKIAASGLTGMRENDDILTCREIIRDVKEHQYFVKIPYAMAINWTDTKNRRNLPIFLDLVRAFATLRHRQRTVDSEGFLIADLQDFVDAKQLYTSREQAQGTKLTKTERKLCEELVKNGHEMSYQALAAKMHVGDTRITQILMGRRDVADSGLIYKVPGLHVERRTEQNSKGGYTSKNYVMLAAGFNPLSFFNEVVSINPDSIPYITYTTLTPNLQLKTRNGKQELTLLTVNENTEYNSNVTEDSHSKDSKESSFLQPEHNTLFVRPENHCKNVSSGSTDSENTDVREDCKPLETSQLIAKTEKSKNLHETVSSGLNISEVHKWFDQWEQVNRTKINSQNYQDAASEYARKFNADLQELEYITCKYAGIEVLQ